MLKICSKCNQKLDTSCFNKDKGKPDGLCTICKRRGWHIDHIVPKNVFNFNSYNDIEFKACWSLENLRPIWCTNNWQRPKDGSDIEMTKEQLINKVKERLNRC